MTDTTPFPAPDASEEAIRAAALAAGLDLPEASMAGVRLNLGLLQDRWAVLSAALREEGE